MKTATTIKVITKHEQLYVVRETLKTATVLGCDIETTDLNQFVGVPRTIQIAIEQDETDLVFVLDLKHLDKQKVKACLFDIFANPKILKIFHNAAFDVKWLRHHFGFEFESLYDTMEMAKLVYAGDFRLSASLLSCVQIFLNFNMNKEEQLSNWKRDILTKEQIQYAGIDAWILLPLREAINSNIREFRLSEVGQIELDCIQDIVDMHLNGFNFSGSEWLLLAENTKRELDELVNKILVMSGEVKMNLNSPDQIKKLLANFGVFVSSTGADILSEYEHIEIVQLVQKYRKMSKQLQSFGESFLKFINKDTGRIHSDFRKIGAYTGRLSCNNPNLMQIPHDAKFRNCFKPSEGNKLIIADYSQFELRITAHVTKEPYFLKAYKEGIDLHTQTTSVSFDVPFAQVLKEQRDIGKRINFGTIYGIGAESFSRKFGVDEDLAEELIKRFYKRHTVLKQWLYNQSSRVKYPRTSYSVAGRIVNLKKCVGKDDNPYNIPKNYPIQSSNADIIKRVVFKLRLFLKKYQAKLVNLVHDEIVIDCPSQYAEELSVIVRRIMIEEAEYYITSVPIDVDVTIADCWSK